MQGGDPRSTDGASSLILFQASCLSDSVDSLVKSKPVVRSIEEPATNPYRFATSATRSGEYTSVMSTPRIVATFVSDPPIPSCQVIAPGPKSRWDLTSPWHLGPHQSRE